MRTGQQEFWKKRNEKLEAENRSLRERLAAFTRENNNLQRSLRDNDRLFHSIPAGIALVQQGRIVDINETALGPLGYRAEEITGRDFLDFVHPDLKAFVSNFHDKRVSGKGMPAEYETELVTKTGETLGCDVRVKKIKLKNRMALLAHLSGNEKRKKREKELIQSNKREAIINMASGLKCELSHSLKTISENIKDIKEFGDSENKALIERWKNIESASNEIIDTTRKLDSLSRRENDPSDVVLFDLKKIVKNAVSLSNPKLKDLAERRKLTINLKTYLRSVSPIEGDPNEIQAMIINLILNAVEAMPRGGDLYLTTEESAGYAHIYIQDGGVGIPDHIKDRILDPFCTTKGGDGVGLGLSIAYAIIKRHRGEIEVTSQKDQGTILTIRLPLASEKQKSKSRPVKRKLKNAIILIIEDEHILRELLAQLFLSKGCRVVTVTSGLEGLHKLKRKKFDLVLADSKTLDVNGAGLVQKIKKMNRELPIVIMTGNEASDGIDKRKRSGADLVINKPLEMNKVVKQVTDVLMFKA